MIIRRWISAGAAAFALVASAGVLPAQLTTGGIGGRVTTAQSENVEGAQVQVRNASTGVSRVATTRGDGRYAVFGLEVGSSYEVTARRIGFAPQTLGGIRVTLSQVTPVDFTLQAQAAQLSTVTVEAAPVNALISPSRKGTATTISDTLLRKLPTLNRNFTDFVALTPQVSTNGPGLSGGGVSNRFNNIQIDGATEKDLFGLGSTGQPGGQANGKSIGLDAVKEYQVLLTPYDIRIGQFAGASINAVTKSGTNEFTGSVFSYGRNQDFQRSQSYLTDYKQLQYGFSLGGPIVRDKVFFFVNPEFQSRSVPAAGPALGDANVRVSQALVDQFTQQLAARGISDAGNGARVNNKNPLANIFARLDFVLPFNSTLVVRHNYAHAEQQIFSRGTTGATPNFPLTSNLYEFTSEKQAPVAQLRTNFANGAFNEAIVGYTRIRDRRTTPGTLQPQVSAVLANTATLVAGTEVSSQANELDQDIFEFTDNFSLPIGGAHRVTVGTQNQFYKVRNLFGQALAGSWTFGTLDSLTAGNPRTYQVGVPVAGDGAVRFRAAQLSGYIQDEWTATNNLSFNLGVRLDVPIFRDKPPENPAVFAEFGRNTSDVPSGNVQFSPRLGFNWNVTGDGRNQLRGGAGLFQGSPAYVWLSNQFQNSGGVSGFATLTCANALAPRFTAATVASAPRACSNNLGATAGSQTDLFDPDTKFPQTFRTNLAYDRDLGAGFVATVEGLYTRFVDALFYQNIALADPQFTGLDGRTLYGLLPTTPTLRSTTRRNAVYAASNQSKDYSYNFTGKLEKRFARNFGGSAAYTYSQSYDVQSLTSSTAASQYRFGRVSAGRQDDQTLHHSAWETPHRVVATGTYTLPTKTSISAIYIGQSGLKYSYVSSGDLNGDNQTQNDPIYIPTGPTDPRGPVFQQYVQTVVRNGASVPDTVTVARQSAAFNSFIDRVDCLSAQRGRINERNSCQTPWTNQLDLSIEQALPTLRGQNLSVRLDAINFGNLLNSNWGRQVSTGNFNPQLLYTQNAIVNAAGSTTGVDLRNGVPRVQFNPDQQTFNYDNVFSNYTLQLSVRYSF